MNHSDNRDIKEQIDLKVWANIQKIFAESINSSVCTIDLEGNDVLFTGDLPLYTKILKTTEYGAEIIKEGRVQAIKKFSTGIDKVLLYYSEDGLLNIWAPIKIREKLIGAMGCVFLKDLNIKKLNFADIIKNTNIDSEELNESLGEMKNISQDEAKIYGSMLHILSKTAPELAKQKYEGDKKILELTTLHKLIKMINSTLKLDKILSYVIEFMVETIKIKNCSIIILDGKNINKGYYFKKIENLGPVQRVIIDEVLNTKNLIRIEDISTDFRTNKITENLNFSSILSFPLKINDDIIGIMNLYLDSLENLSHEDFEFISVVADQVAMAIFNAKKFEEAKETAVIDKLTDLYNRRYFIDKLKDQYIKDIDQKKALSVAMLDIDDFKQYNDTNGHIKGDLLIKQTADILKKEVRGVDVVGRYGGEEFIIIFPELNNGIAYSMVDNIRKKIENMDIFNKEKQPSGKVTVSAGLVSFMDKTITYDELIELVDKAMYKSKISGKNKITSVVVIDKNLPQIDVGEVKDFHNDDVIS